MAVSSSDMYNLSQDPTFQNRVMIIAVQQCIVVGQEDSKTALHKERQAYAVAIENNPTMFKNQLAISVSTDIGVIGDATANGTVPITTPQIAATQAALVTDIHIIGALQGQFNTFFVN